jgi:protein TonB
MDIRKILETDYLDLLFEGRNKKYGSYELRKNYPKRALRSLFVLVALALAIGSYAIISNIKGKEPVKPAPIVKEITLVEPPPIDPKKPPPPPPPSEPPPPVKPTVKFTPPVIKKDEEVKEEEKPAEVEELKEAAAGLTTQEGDPDGIDPGIIDNPGDGTGVVEAAPKEEIFTYVEQMPSPAYDHNEFLAKNLRYPEFARQNNIQGRVMVRFLVSETGEISEVSVVRGIGGGCDEEAKRVVSKFPKWNPGKQNGRPVKVWFTLPINFVLE